MSGFMVIGTSIGCFYFGRTFPVIGAVTVLIFTSVCLSATDKLRRQF